MCCVTFDLSLPGQTGNIAVAHTPRFVAVNIVRIGDKICPKFCENLKKN